MQEFEFGGSMTDISARIFPAGKALNVAKVIRTLGEEVQITGLMPTNDTRRFRRCCEESNIAVSFYEVEGSVRINTTISESANGQVTHISSPGPRLSARIEDEFIGFLENQISSDDFGIFSGSLPAGFSDDAYFRALQACHARGAETLLDSRGKAFSLGIRAKPIMVKPNLSELEAFFGEHIQGVHHIALKGKRLCDLGIEYVFISLGSDGMIAIHDTDCLLCSVPDVDAIDTVGCGDALVAGLAVGRSRSFSFSETCRMAAACGASKAMHVGPGAVSMDQVWRIMEDVRIEAV
jgi:1-phosphofructokinase family hexose kinase